MGGALAASRQLANEFSVMRQLCLYRQRRDPTSYVPEHSWAPVKESTFFPYIFSQDEIPGSLAVASGARHWTLHLP
ncbi:hypothetical protein NKH16_23945 [Mesorhizobium sp. M1307]|uniref:hypothetical protein n=1 Tax=Mesorhizobium sp. M1307 TaxID=2957079 RepID=UPI003337F646